MLDDGRSSRGTVFAWVITGTLKMRLSSAVSPM